jgi:DNA-binding response OmpR family regulator
VPRLLVIETDETARKSMVAELRAEYEVLEAGDTAQGLGLALNSGPDCILLDLSAPQFEGLELCHALCSNSHTRTIPVFVMVNDRAPSSREFWLNLGVREVFPKPLEYPRLRAALDGVSKKAAVGEKNEVQVQLKVVLKLIGVAETGKAFELLTATDQVSANGFQCRFSVPVEVGSVVDVYHVLSEGERRVGRARVLSTDWGGLPWQTCSFQFTEKTSPWIV